MRRLTPARTPSTEPFAPVSQIQQPAFNPNSAPGAGPGSGPAPVFGPGMAPPPAAAQALAQVQPPKKSSALLPAIVTFIVCVLLLAGGLFGYKKLTEPSGSEAAPPASLPQPQARILTQSPVQDLMQSQPRKTPTTEPSPVGLTSPGSSLTPPTWSHGWPP